MEINEQNQNNIIIMNNKIMFQLRHLDLVSLDMTRPDLT